MTRRDDGHPCIVAAYRDRVSHSHSLKSEEAMSEVRLILRDGARDIETNSDKGFARCVVAALSAETESFEELSVASRTLFESGRMAQLQ